MRRDNICKTQCSFVLNSLQSGGGDPDELFFFETDTLQAPGIGRAPQPPPGQPPGPNRKPVGPPPPQKKRPGNSGPFPTGLGPGAALFAGRPVNPPPPPILSSGSIIPPPPPPRPPVRNSQGGGATIFPNEGSGDRPPVPGAPSNGGNNPSRPKAQQNAPNLPPGQPSQPSINRQPRPLFSFLPRLPNLSELFGL